MLACRVQTRAASANLSAIEIKILIAVPGHNRGRIIIHGGCRPKEQRRLGPLPEGLAPGQAAGRQHFRP